MIFYKYKDNILISKAELISEKDIEEDNFLEITEAEAIANKGKIFALNKMEPEISRRSYVVTDEEFLFLEKEDLNILRAPILSGKANEPWIEEAIKERRVIAVNILYPNWKEVLIYKEPEKWKVNVIGLGDVGGTLLTGLKLLGVRNISSLGIYDKDKNRIDRWKFELGQILSPEMDESIIEINPLVEDELFNCDIFVFCVSVGVPEVGKENQDVRLIQFNGNAKIIREYARKAREKNFKGVFAVVSDPVDLLCKVAFIESNKGEAGELDFKGLAPEQIRGYGLGVMNARACYYAIQDENTKHYVTEGRAFGPHGEGLIIADSIKDYNSEISEALTHRTKTANLEVRGTGFKPYVAPALSSGALPIIATINYKWHYSTTFIGGTFMGCRNRMIHGCTELETLDIPEDLFKKLLSTYELLDNLYNGQKL